VSEQDLAGRDLVFGYTRSRPAIRGVSVALRPGTLTALLGPNGSGKSTLVRLLSGALAPWSGEVRLGARPLATWPRRELAQQLGVVPQGTHLAFPFTVSEVVLMGRAPHLGRFAFEREADRAIAWRALQDTDTTELRDRLYAECSGGEQQRVLLARALAQEPRVLLLDEPTAHLDLRHQVEVYELLTRLVRDRALAVAIVSHDLNLPARFATSMVLLAEGQVAAEGAPADVLTRERLEAVYRTPLEVTRSPTTGHVTVHPLARPTSRS
jgi:iron complex transport system ATP-binding protein